jgi:uncharacterized protein
MQPQIAWADSPAALSPAQAGVQIAAFLRKVYGWMFAGLLVTAGVATWVVSTPEVSRTLLRTPFLYFGLFIAELAMVVFLSARATRMSATAAGGCFVAYAAMNGVTLSPIILVYTGAAIGQAFMVTAGTFGAMALWGTITKKDLTSFGHFMGMGLFGIILASVVGMFWHDPGLYFAINVVGVIVFVGLAAYDAQKMKALALAAPGGPTVGYAVVGALSLYLDFINLFLFILRLFGRRR